MTVLTSVGVGVLCAVCALVLRECKSPLTPLLTLLGGMLLLTATLPRLSPLFAWVETLEAALPLSVGERVGKVLAVGFLSSVGKETCGELGAPSLGTRIELIGRVEILLLSLPVLTELYARVEALLA